MMMLRGIRMASHGISTSSGAHGVSSGGGAIIIGLSRARSDHGISTVESQTSASSSFFVLRVSVMSRSFQGSFTPSSTSSSFSSSSKGSSSTSASESTTDGNIRSGRIRMPVVGSAISRHGNSILESHVMDSSENSRRKLCMYGS